MNLIKLLAATAVLFAATAVQAQQDYPRDIEITWENSSEYVDGTLIEAGDLVGVRIEIFRGQDAVAMFVATVPASGEGLVQVENFVGAIDRPGTYRIVGYSVVIGGINSDASAPIFRKYTGKPLPPVLSVEVG